MALLLRDREPSPETAAPAPVGDQSVVVPDYACATCGAGMHAGQDWCLECGSAAPGRLGARPGWRGAFTVVALTALLVTSAVVASYAALSGDAEREAARPSIGSGNPIVAQTPPPAPATGAVPPGTVTPPAGAVVPPAGTTTPSVKAPTPKGGAKGGSPFVTLPGAGAPGKSGVAGNRGNSGKGDSGAQNTGTSGASGTSPSTSQNTSPGRGSSPTAAPAATVQAIGFNKDAMSTYDPYQRAGAEFGPAGNAADDDTGTVWDVTVPADGEALRVGLVVDLGAAYALSSLKVSTPTPGFEMEIYASEGAAKPTDILDKRWEHLTDRRDVPDGVVVSLQGKSDNKFRQVVLWFTSAKDAVDPRVAIGEVSVRGSR